MKKQFIRLDQAQLVARPLFDGIGALLQVAHFCLHRAIAGSQRLVVQPLGIDLLIKIPDPHPAALAQPERVLDAEDQQCEQDG